MGAGPVTADGAAKSKAIVEFQGWQRFRLYVSVFKINN